MEINAVDLASENRKIHGPICPWCKHEYDSINVARITSTFGKRYVYFCTHCRATLGISHRKGFWMG